MACFLLGHMSKKVTCQINGGVRLGGGRRFRFCLEGLGEKGCVSLCDVCVRGVRVRDVSMVFGDWNRL